MDFQITVRRYKLLPRIINDYREGRIVRAYICSRLDGGYTDAWYRILPGKSLAGERPRSLFVSMNDGSEAVYKLTGIKTDGNTEVLTFLLAER